MTIEDSFSFDPALMGHEGPQGELVYDHKMLWRANLYIDVAEDDGRDWNDSHPWATGNEWNLDANGNAVTGDNAGTQVVDFPGYTWISDTNKLDRVAYDLSGRDSPQEFVYKMNSQMNLLNTKYNSNGDLLSDQNNNPWGQTLAPGNNWDNYFSGIVAGNDSKPYRPGLSNLASQQGLAWDENRGKKAAGVDCIGFTQRCASYSGNTYIWDDLEPLLWDDSIVGVRNYPHSVNALQEITNYTLVEDILTDNGIISTSQNLQFIVPGDIAYYDGHIMMVAKVNHSSSRENIRLEDIVFIESTSSLAPYTWGYVQNTRDLQNRQNDNKNWVIGRLK